MNNISLSIFYGANTDVGLNGQRHVLLLIEHWPSKQRRETKKIFVEQEGRSQEFESGG